MWYDDGFKLFVCILSPEYVDSTMSASTFDKTLDTLRKGEKKRPQGLRSFQNLLSLAMYGCHRGTPGTIQPTIEKH